MAICKILESSANVLGGKRKFRKALNSVCSTVHFHVFSSETSPSCANAWEKKIVNPRRSVNGIVNCKLHEHLNSVTVNQLLFLTNYVHECHEINQFETPYFRNIKVDYLGNAMLQAFKNLFAARNIRDNEALPNLVNISRMLRFTVYLLNFSVLKDQVPVV